MSLFRLLSVKSPSELGYAFASSLYWYLLDTLRRYGCEESDQTVLLQTTERYVPWSFSAGARGLFWTRKRF